ncbi:hypothetical protein B0H67DRAFT_14404 [Lasiosphaeris hirsuta]|uniref:Uncharacterized protein n=1 Tax=Lasiosphaeris hirsuta TaxID=260670 RepID=A0AA40B922_9PEZI|nr:hypothetical protein B0H67DRAFT_14404 [Lasiosphaeris hirsuta]
MRHLVVGIAAAFCSHNIQLCFSAGLRIPRPTQQLPPPGEAMPRIASSAALAELPFPSPAKPPGTLPSKTTASGCTISVNPLSLAPNSSVLSHTNGCGCGAEYDRRAVGKYLLAWVIYRIDWLEKHPLDAVSWARTVYKQLQLGEEVELELDAMEVLHDVCVSKGETAVWGDYFGRAGNVSSIRSNIKAKAE